MKSYLNSLLNLKDSKSGVIALFVVMALFFYLTAESLNQNSKVIAKPYHNSNATEILNGLKDGPIFSDEELVAVVYRDPYISFQIPQETRVFNAFPSLMKSLDLTQIDPNQAKSQTDNVMNTSVLSFVGNNSSLLGKIILKFKNTFDNERIIELPYILNENDTDFFVVAERSLKGMVFNDEISKIAKDLDVPLESIILRRISSDDDFFISPYTNVIDFIKTFRNEENGTFIFGELRIDVLKFPFGIQPHSPTRHVKQLKDKINEMASEIYSKLELIEPSMFVTTILDVLAEFFEKEKIPLSEEKLNEIKRASLTALTNRFKFFLEKYFNINLFNDYTWAELKEKIKPDNLKNKSLRQEFDVELIIGSDMICFPDLPSVIVDRFHKVLVALSTKRKVPQNKLFFGTIIYSAYVKVNQIQYTLIMSLGFLHLMNYSPKVTDHHEILPETYSFYCCNTKPLLFGAPIQCVRFTQMKPESNKGILETPSGSFFVIEFPTNESFTDFWLMLEICQNIIKKPFISPPFPDLKISQSYATISGGERIFTANIKAGVDCWTVSYPFSKYMKKLCKIYSRYRKPFPTLISLDSPLQEVNSILRGNEKKRDVWFNRIISYESIIKHVKKPVFDCNDLLKSATIELSFTANEAEQFRLFKILGIVDFARSFANRSISLFQYQVKHFSSMLSVCRIYTSPLLHFACLFSDDIEMLQILMDNFDINYPDDDQRTALFYSTRNPSFAPTQMLLKHKIDPDKGDKTSETPLISTINNGFFEMSKYLVRNGSSINQTLLEFHNPSLVFSLQNGKIKIFKELLEYCPTCYLNYPIRDGKYLTHLCISLNLDEPLYLLATKSPGFDPNRYTNEYPHPLHYFFSLPKKDVKTSLSVFKALLSIPNLDLNAYDKEGQTPLIRAIQYNSKNLLSYLISDPRCDLDFQNINGETPLSIAVNIGSLNAVTKLLEGGALIDAPNDDEEKNTPFMLAVKKNNVKIVEKFIEFGLSNPNKWYNANGLLPYHIAQEENLTKIQEIFKSKNINCDFESLK